MALEPARTSVQVTICLFAVDDQEPGLGFCPNTPRNCWGHILQIHSLSLLRIFIRNILLPFQVWSFRIDIHRQPSGDPATIDRPIIPDNETRNQMSSICPRLAYHLLSCTHLHLKRAIFQWHEGWVFKVPSTQEYGGCSRHHFHNLASVEERRMSTWSHSYVTPHTSMYYCICIYTGRESLDEARCE